MSSGGPRPEKRPELMQIVQRLDPEVTSNTANKALLVIEKYLGSLNPAEQEALTQALDTLVVLGVGRSYPNGDYGDSDE